MHHFEALNEYRNPLIMHRIMEIKLISCIISQTEGLNCKKKLSSNTSFGRELESQLLMAHKRLVWVDSELGNQRIPE